MESVENPNNDGTSQFLQYLSLPAEANDREESPQKRTKLDNQNFFQRFTTSSAKYNDIELIKNHNQRKQESTFSAMKTTQTNELAKSCTSVRQRPSSSSVWDIVDPQGSVRGLSAPKPPFKCTGGVYSFIEKQTKPPKVLTPIVYCNCTLHPPADGIVPKPKVKKPLGCKTVLVSGLPMTLGYEMLIKLFSYFGTVHQFSRRKKMGFYQITYECESSVDKVVEVNGYTLVTSNDKETFKGTMQINYANIWTERLEYNKQIEAFQKEKTENEGVLLEPQCSTSNNSLATKFSIQSNTSLELPSNLNSTFSRQNIALEPSNLNSNFSSEISTSLEPSVLDTPFSKQYLRNMIREIKSDDFFKFNSNLFVHWIEKGKCNRRRYKMAFLDVLEAMHKSVDRIKTGPAKLEELVVQHRGSLTEKHNSNSLIFKEIYKVFEAVTSPNVLKNFSFKLKKQIEEWKKNIQDKRNTNFCDSILEIAKCNEEQRNSIEEHQNRELEDLEAKNERLKNELRVAQREASKSNKHQIHEKSDEVIKIEKLETKHFDNNHDKNCIELLEKESHIFAMICIFLGLHRYGESIEGICEYLFKIDPTVTSQNVESLMRKFPTVFQEEAVEDLYDSEIVWTISGI